jgi:hypothetical protein
MMRSIMHSVIVLFLGAISFSDAHANTLVIMLRIDDVIFIAADSKLSKANGRDIGSACKIHVTDQFVWATSGILNDPRSTFDTWATTEAAIKAGGSFDEIVSRFDRELASQLKELLPRIKRDDPLSYDETVKSGHAVTVFFIKNFEVRISDFTLPNKETPNGIEVIDQSCPGNLCISNPKMIAMMGYFDAAKIEVERRPQILDQMGIMPALNYLMDIQHNATPTRVAPPVSILQVDKSGALSWLQNGVCN